MNYFKGDKVILIKECNALKMVGNIYEVANITNTNVIIRDEKTKVAIGAVDITVFDQYFKKPEEVKGWTDWQRVVDQQGNIVAFYRTNNKKVRVRMPDENGGITGVCAEATCNKEDEFNLYFGINLAYRRCMNKILKNDIKNHEKILKNLRSNLSENQHDMKKMINSLDKVTE